MTEAHLSSFAVVRPFAPVDTDHVARSFDIWDSYLPCTTTPSIPVDLFLCFSQDVNKNDAALNATQTVMAHFEERKLLNTTWQHCFRSVQVISANLLPQDDMYQPLHPLANASWVRGPNLQFLAMATEFERRDYGSWYLMEMDSVPRRSGWLQDLLSEVEQRAPFAILGSFYRGDSWDSISLPPAVKLHINGNAVYNGSNSLLQSLVEELRYGMANGSALYAFDVMLAQYYLDQALPAQQFAWFIGNSTTIGNYAHTSMIDAYFAQEAVVHGAWLFDEWDHNAAPVALVVSDFGLVEADGHPQLETFKAKLLAGHHPFRQVVVMRPLANVTSGTTVSPTSGLENVNFTEVGRTDSVWLDWCSAPVNSPWFMYTNVLFDMRRRIDLLRDPVSGTPVVDYINASSVFCTNSSSCMASIQQASQYAGQPVDRHVNVHHMLFHTETRNQFCTDWLANHQQDPTPAPSADEYVAFLQMQGLINKYTLVDAFRYGQRQRGAMNGTHCDFIPEEGACVATQDCSWRPHFGTCFLGTLPATPTPAQFTVVANYSGCQGATALPTLHVTAQQPAALEFQVVVVAPFQSSSSTSMLQVANGATGLVALHVGQNASVADLTVGIVTLTTTMTSPRLVTNVPFTAYDLSAWTISTNYSGSQVVVTGTQGTTLQTDAVADTNSLNELMLDVGSQHWPVIVQQWGTVQDVDLVKCHTVFAPTSGAGSSGDASHGQSGGATIGVGLPLSSLLATSQDPMLQEPFAAEIAVPATTSLSFVLVLDGSAAQCPKTFATALAEGRVQPARRNPVSAASDSWLLDVWVQVGGVYTICVQRDGQAVEAYPTPLVVFGPTSVAVQGATCLQDSPVQAVGESSTVEVDITGFHLQPDDVVALVGTSADCSTMRSVALSSLYSAGNMGLGEAVQILSVPQGGVTALDICYSHAGHWYRLATCLRTTTASGTAASADTALAPAAWISIAVVFSVAAAVLLCLGLYMWRHRIHTEESKMEPEFYPEHPFEGASHELTSPFGSCVAMYPVQGSTLAGPLSLIPTPFGVVQAVPAVLVTPRTPAALASAPNSALPSPSHRQFTSGVGRGGAMDMVSPLSGSARVPPPSPSMRLRRGSCSVTPTPQLQSPTNTLTPRNPLNPHACPSPSSNCPTMPTTPSAENTAEAALESDPAPEDPVTSQAAVAE